MQVLILSLRTMNVSFTLLFFSRIKFFGNTSGCNVVPLSNFINMPHPSKPVTSVTVPLNVPSAILLLLQENSNSNTGIIRRILFINYFYAKLNSPTEIKKKHHLFIS